MKANLTRGNSITENYIPSMDIDQALSLVQMYARILRPKLKLKEGSKPGGLTIVGERGPELVEHVNEWSDKIYTIKL
jgi:hypothetical protein